MPFWAVLPVSRSRGLDHHDPEAELQPDRVWLHREREVASTLRPMLNDAAVGEMLTGFDRTSHFFDDLGCFIVDVLSEVYQEHRAWDGEVLDLVDPASIRKIG